MKRILLIGAIVAGIGIAVVAGLAWTVLKRPNTAFAEEGRWLFVPTGSSFEALEMTLENDGFLSDIESFRTAARIKRFTRPKAGRYRVVKGMSNAALVNMLRSGDQRSLLIRLDGMRTLPELAGVLGRSLEADSSEFIAAFTDPSFLDSLGLDVYTLPSFFIADSYDFFWNTSPQQFLERMTSIHDRFWNTERMAKASGLGLERHEVVTLASIVKGETAQLSEAPKIAGLYLNRLRAGIPLQSDPTVVFAAGITDARRVLFSDLETDSPYNTYQHAGLPPGPIFLTEAAYIDAVLSPESHTYIYMCAKPDRSGLHNFSETYAQHQVYANEYRRWLDERQIGR